VKRFVWSLSAQFICVRGFSACKLTVRPGRRTYLLSRGVVANGGVSRDALPPEPYFKSSEKLLPIASRLIRTETVDWRRRCESSRQQSTTVSDSACRRRRSRVDDVAKHKRCKYRCATWSRHALLRSFIVQTVQDSRRLSSIQFTSPDATKINSLVASAV